MKIINKYWDTVYFLLLIFAPIACICAGVCITILRIHGLYSNVSWPWFFLFDGSQLFYLILSIYFICKRKQENTNQGSYFLMVKWYTTISLLIQYNFLMHIFMTDYMWACTFLFLILIVFLFDKKMLLMNIVAYIFSFTLSHLLHGEQLISSEPEHIIDNLCFRIVMITLYSIFLVAITYFMEKFIGRIQMEEDENQFLMAKQLEYYQSLDIMDKELRKFRHDIHNHFLCLQNLIENDNYSEPMSLS